MVEVRLPDGPVVGAKSLGPTRSAFHGADGLEADIILKHVEEERTEIPLKGHFGELVDVEGGESTITNGRDAVWNGHAGEAFLKKAASQWS